MVLEDASGSFDCGSCDETARTFAQDDGVYFQRVRGGLVLAEGFDGFEEGGLPGGVDAGDDAAEAEGSDGEGG